ncbi:MAG: alanyl-tRNA editing protein [Terriglobia bacterium]|nr:MAG: alanyl-tRNA editing protein [Terriglobia bacterium]
MTERLYYHDSYLRSFTGSVVDAAGDALTIYLDRTAFYPTSGGQPFDTGFIAGVPVVEVIDEGERIAHRVAAPVTVASAECSIDWQRRFDHMQQHSGQHLLSAVFEELFQLHTVSFHLGQESATIDLEGGPVENRVILEAERRANELVFENRAVAVQFESPGEVQGLRKPSEREGTLRIVSIEGIDRTACGGTHVRATGEIGPILIRKLEKIRQTVRVEFLCGGRAVRRARADFQALARIAQLYSAPLDETPALAEGQLEAARVAEKARRKLELDLAVYRGKELYDAATPGPDGFRRHTVCLGAGSMDELRAVAQSFTGRSKAVFVALLEKPPSILYAVSEDSGLDAGRAVKDAVTEAGGRGGGSTRVAQGSVPNVAGLEKVARGLA